MDLFRKATVTEVEEYYTVHFPKGKIVNMKDRPSFGLSLCVSGQLTYTTGNEIIQSTPGCAILLPKGGSYQIHGDKEGVFPVVNFQCQGLACDRVIAVPLSNPQSCLRDSDTLRTLLQQGADRPAVMAAFYTLLSKVSASQDKPNDPLNPVLRQIEAQLSDPGLSNAILAQNAHISETYLRKLFHQKCRTTPKQYILELRIQKAKLLLSENTETVSAVAERCGFTSVYHFSKVFKARTGTSPTLYAATHRRDKI
jgi:AraC-like DNA-binding protein